MGVSIEFLSDHLKRKGVRPSYQRIKVLEYLRQNGGHPTVDEIYRALRPAIPSLSKVTIYNTLRTFVEVGLLQAVEIDESEKRYDIAVNTHGHFQCEACGAIYDFQVAIDQVPVEGLSHFKITQKKVYFKGLCPDCLNHSTRNRKAKPND